MLCSQKPSGASRKSKVRCFSLVRLHPLLVDRVPQLATGSGRSKGPKNDAKLKQSFQNQIQTAREKPFGMRYGHMAPPFFLGGVSKPRRPRRFITRATSCQAQLILIFKADLKLELYSPQRSRPFHEPAAKPGQGEPFGDPPPSPPLWPPSTCHYGCQTWPCWRRALLSI